MAMTNEKMHPFVMHDKNAFSVRQWQRICIRDTIVITFYQISGKVKSDRLNFYDRNKVIYMETFAFKRR